MNATSTEVKTRFGEFMDRAQKEPVTVNKAGRKFAVLLGYEEYERLVAADDALWSARAVEAEKSGYVSPEEASALVEKLRAL